MKLHKAIELGQRDIAISLIEKGGNIQAEDIHGNTPLHIAARFGEAEITKALLSCGANIEATNNLKRTPLHSAMFYKPKHPEDTGAILELINQGANKEAMDVQGYTPYKLAIISANEIMQAELLKAGADPRPQSVTHAFRPVRAGSSGSQSSFSLEPSGSDARQGSSRP